MNHHDVLVELHALPVLLVAGEENLLGMPRQLVLGAVKGVVKCLGYLEEIVPAGDDVPVRDHLQFCKHWNQAVEHLGDSSTDRSGVDHLQRLALEIAGEE